MSKESKFIPKPNEERSENHALQMALAKGRKVIGKRHSMDKGPQMTKGNRRVAVQPRKGG